MESKSNPVPVNMDGKRIDERREVCDGTLGYGVE
jgi:hypothetical protein